MGKIEHTADNCWFHCLTFAFNLHSLNAQHRMIVFSTLKYWGCHVLCKNFQMCEWCCASDVYISNRIHNDTALSFPRYQCISILWDMHLFCLICSDTNTIKKWIFHAIPIHTLIKFDNSLTRPQSSVYTTTLPEILCFNQQIFATTKKLLSMENLNLWVSSPRKSFCMTQLEEIHF